MHGQPTGYIYMHNDFLSNIEKLLGRRDLYPWSDRIGLGRGVANGIAKGTPPKADALTVISRAENVRIDWLLKGEGTPYSIIRARSDGECAEIIEEHLGEEEWRVHLVTDGTNTAYVLTQPGQYQIKDRMVDYTILEVITGPCGNEAAQAIYRRAFHFESKPLEHYLVDTDKATMRDLITGNMGTYAIALSDHALLRKAKSVTADFIATFVASMSLLHESGALQPQRSVAEIAENYQGIEAEVIEVFRAIPDAEKEKALRILKILKTAI